MDTRVVTPLPSSKIPFPAGSRSRRKTSCVLFVSPATRLSDMLAKATNRPSAESEGYVLSRLPCTPAESTLTRTMPPVARSLTKMSIEPFVSPATRFDARLSKATQWSSAESAGDSPIPVPPLQLFDSPFDASTSRARSTAPKGRGGREQGERRRRRTSRSGGSWTWSLGSVGVGSFENRRCNGTSAFRRGSARRKQFSARAARTIVPCSHARSTLRRAAPERRSTRPPVRERVGGTTKRATSGGSSTFKGLVEPGMREERDVVGARR
jgi:hypothetical protein